MGCGGLFFGSAVAVLGDFEDRPANFMLAKKMLRSSAQAAMESKTAVSRSALSPANSRTGQAMEPIPQAMFTKFSAAARRAPEISAMHRFVAGMAIPKPKPYNTVDNNAMYWLALLRPVTPAAMRKKPSTSASR